MSDELRGRRGRAELARLAPKDVAEPDIIARLEALSEDRILDYFWLMDRRGASRLELLLQLSQVKVQRPADWDVRAVRLEHESGRTPGRKVDPKCFGCARVTRLFYHHILEIQHGGSNALRNQVALCFKCHKFLHPWLEEPKQKAERNEFESVGDIMPRAVGGMLEEIKQA